MNKMNYDDLRKNRLDLEYKFESQKAIVCFTAMIITALGILGAMFVKGEYVIGISLSVFLFLYAGAFYRKIKKKMDSLFKENRKH